LPDIEFSNGLKPKGKIDLDPLEWAIIAVTVIISIFIYRVF